MNIDGLGKRVIEQFWDLNIIKEPSSIYKLNYNKIKNLEGWGDLSIKNLRDSVDKSRKINLDNFIFSIGIRHIGQENAKIIASYLGSSKKFEELFNEKKNIKILNNLLELDGIGETQINSLKTFFSNSTNVKIVKDLIVELKIDEYKIVKSNGIFSNKKIMFTGGFENISRSEAKIIAENNGGKVLGSVSKKLDYLVVGNSKPTKKKIDQARDLKIKILTEKEWNNILNN